MRVLVFSSVLLVIDSTPSSAPLVTGSCDLSVLFALQLLSTPDVLRIPVLNEAGAPVGVLSQFDLVRYLLHHHEHHVASCESLASLGLADRDSHSVSARGTDTVIACLRCESCVCVCDCFFFFASVC